jgi:hypothetical protein
MILGYDFVEERLFAARGYANPSEEDAKLLRNFGDNIARRLKDLRRYNNMREKCRTFSRFN